MLFEEQLDLPTQAVELGNGERGQGKVAGEKHQPLARCGILEPDSSQRRVEALLRALEYVRKTGAKILGVVGRYGGYTKQVADVCILTPSTRLR